MDEQSVTVVVVDDDESVRKALKRLLRSNGYQVLTFESAEDLLSSGSLVGNVCLVLDIRLPGMSGFDLYGSLASSGRQVPVIFMTAHDNPLWQKMVDEAGGIACLRKPFGEHSLLGAIHAACGGLEWIPQKHEET